MARAIVVKEGKRHTMEGPHVTAVVGVVVGSEYFEVSVNAYDDRPDHKGGIVVTKVTSKDSKPKEVYHVPKAKKVRKEAPKGQEASTTD